jgi:preprotein translocase subunit SecD
LPGIAGIVLTMGTAVMQILLFMKEQKKNYAETLEEAVKTSYS